jgi:hypothetical protein
LATSDAGTPSDSTNQTHTPVDPAQSAANHRQSDVDSSKFSQHHTLGVGPNQASPGNHNHDGVNSLLDPAVTLLQQQMFPTRNYRNNLVWWSSGVQPVIGNGLIESDFIHFGKLYFGTFHWKKGSTTTTGTGDWSFEMPAPPGAVGALNLWHGYIINNTSRVFPIAGIIRGGNIDRIVASDVKTGGATYLGGSGWQGAWQNNDELFMAAWWWDS